MPELIKKYHSVRLRAYGWPKFERTPASAGPEGIWPPRPPRDWQALGPRRAAAASGDEREGIHAGTLRGEAICALAGTDRILARAAATASMAAAETTV